MEAIDATVRVSAADEQEVRALYQSILDGWNAQDAERMAAPFTDVAEIIGYDGSHYAGREAFAAGLRAIFAGHRTPAYVARVQAIHRLTPDTVLLRAIAGLVPPGSREVRGDLNAVQTVVAIRQGASWRVALFQNTPAQLHGRPELVRAMTDELQALV